MTDTAKQAGDYPHGMETGIAPENCLCQACKYWRAKTAALREEVERLRSVEKALETIGRDYGDPAAEVKKLASELGQWMGKHLELTIEIAELRAALREGQKGSE